MSGIAAPNLETQFFNATDVAAREAEVPAASFTDGLNPGGGCNMGIGINTGEYGPKRQDWWYDVDAVDNGYIGFSGNIGGSVAAITVQNPDGWLTAYDRAGSDTAPDASYGNLNVINKTGATIPAGFWAWGVVNPMG